MPHLKYGSNVVSDLPPGRVGNNKEVADNIFILILPVKGISCFSSFHTHHSDQHPNDHDEFRDWSLINQNNNTQRKMVTLTFIS